MKCIKCKKLMVVVKSDESENIEKGKKYLRTIYHCEADDVWINVEVPKENN